MELKHKELLLEIITEDLPFNCRSLFKKRHNLNFGLYESAFESHDYGYYLCSVVYKRYIFTKDVKYKELYTVLKLKTDLNLYDDIIYLGDQWKFRNILSKLFDRAIAKLYFFYYRTLGKNKSITLGRKLKVMESSYERKGIIPVTIDQLKSALIKNRKKKK